MSEIKGQLLGMLLVITIFGAIAAVLFTSFKKAADNVASEVEVNTTATAQALPELSIHL